VGSVPFVSVDTSTHSVLDLELPSIPCLRLCVTCFRRTRTRKTHAHTSAHAREANTLTRLWCRYKGRDDADDLEGSNHTPAAVATFIMQHLPQIVSVFQPSELPILHRSTPLHNAPQPNHKPLPPSPPPPDPPPCRSALIAPIPVLYSAKADVPDLWKRLALQ